MCAASRRIGRTMGAVEARAAGALMIAECRQVTLAPISMALAGATLDPYQFVRTVSMSHLLLLCCPSPVICRRRFVLPLMLLQSGVPLLCLLIDGDGVD